VDVSLTVLAPVITATATLPTPSIQFGQAEAAAAVIAGTAMIYTPEINVWVRPTLWPLSQYAAMMKPPPPECDRLVSCPVCGEPLEERDGIQHCPRGNWQSDPAPLFPVGARRSWGGY
jgi:hypothetical protein